MLVGPLAHGQIRLSHVGVCDLEDCRARKRIVHRDGHCFPERGSDAGKDGSGTCTQLIQDRRAFLVLQREVGDIPAGYPDGFRRREIADDALLAGHHRHYAAVHVAVEVYADIPAIDARAFRGETRGACPGNQDKLQKNSARGSHIRIVWIDRIRNPAIVQFQLTFYVKDKSVVCMPLFWRPHLNVHSSASAARWLTRA